MSVIKVHESVDEIERALRRAFPTVKRRESVTPSRPTHDITCVAIARSCFGLNFAPAFLRAFSVTTIRRGQELFVLTNR